MKQITDNSENAMFNIIEQLLKVQNHQVLNYLNGAMNDYERDKHGDNIMSYLVDAKAATAHIKLQLSTINKNLR